MGRRAVDEARSMVNTWNSDTDELFKDLHRKLDIARNKMKALASTSLNKYVTTQDETNKKIVLFKQVLDSLFNVVEADASAPELLLPVMRQILSIPTTDVEVPHANDDPVWSISQFFAAKAGNPAFPPLKTYVDHK
jgi:hypothetical protein